TSAEPNASLDKAAPSDMSSYYPLEDVKVDLIPNAVKGAPIGKIIDPVEQHVAKDPPVVVDGHKGKGLQLNGDDALWFANVGKFSRGQAFTVGLWVWVPKGLKEGVIIHNMESSVLYRYRGYQVGIEDNKFDVRVAHDFPYDSIHLLSRQQ